MIEILMNLIILCFTLHPEVDYMHTLVQLLGYVIIMHVELDFLDVCLRKLSLTGPP